MGILGDLIYPGNEKRAAELNEKEDNLRKTYALQNDLVNSYRHLGESIKTFDAYLMAIMVMQYHIAYTEEDLENLPDLDLPKLSSSTADTLEELALELLSIKMAIDGIKAIKNKVSNPVKESGIVKKTGPQGEEALSKELGGEVETLSMRTSILKSGNVDLLTTTKNGTELKELSSELDGEATSVSQAIARSSSEGAEMSEEMVETSQVAEQVSAVAKTTTEVAEGASGASIAWAALGPVLLAVSVVMEILSTIQRGQDRDKLIKAEKDMDGIQKQADESIKDLKSVFTNLLNAGETDIDAYNKLLPQLAALEHSPMFDRGPFSTTGIDAYIKGMDQITADSPGGVEGYEVAAEQNIDDATNFIREHAIHDSAMTDVIKQIKTHMRKNGLTTLADDDPFLSLLADADSIDLAQVILYNQFRVLIATTFSTLLPYHEQINQETTVNAPIAVAPKTVPTATPDPSFDPKPADFTVPGIGKGLSAASSQ
ncbi:MAG TPA: hypothetical protein VF131_17035 [Blastocatellia bacterium]|nr:hypothetical protein [Blastocatellia bacterium]